jgi:translation initiation factor 3 subunit I
MKPLVLQGHSRPIKHIKFNEAGDTLFTASADRTVISWNTATGEKLKIYTHSAAVNTFLLSSDGIYMVSGDNTGTIYIWDIKSGAIAKKLENVNLQSVRSLDLSSNDALLLVVYAGLKKGAESNITIYKLNDIIGNDVKTNYDKDSIYSAVVPSGMTNEQITPFKVIQCNKDRNTKFSSAKFVHMNKNVLVSREDGYMEFISVTHGKTITEYKFHKDSILDFDVDPDNNIVLTAGKDGIACIFSLDTFELITTIEPKDPVRNLNACKIYINDQQKAKKEVSSNSFGNNSKGPVDPFDFNKIFNINIDDLFNSGIQNKDKTNNLAIIAGGQDSKLVTTTHQKEGGFEVLGYGVYKGENMFSLQAHFGPVNCLSINKAKKLLATGSEDSAVKIFSIENIDNLK